MTVARVLGYWREERPELDPRLTLSSEQVSRYEQMRERGLRWPDPRTLVDPGWQEDERTIVIEYLRTGSLVNQYRGLSPCRLCGRHNGSAEFADETFCWPEGLAHYLDAHSVRLPGEFVEHAVSRHAKRRSLPAPEFDRLGQRDRAWPGIEFETLLWTPDPPADEHQPDLELDPVWWLQQAALFEQDHGLRGPG